MIKAIVRNPLGSPINEAKFATQAEAEAWIQSLDQGGVIPDGSTIDYEDVTAEVAQAAKVSKAKEKRAFCLEMIDMIAAYNDENASSQQMSVIFSNPSFVGCVLALLTGAPKTAKEIMIAHGAEVYPQALVDQFVGKIEIFLAGLGE